MANFCPFCNYASNSEDELKKHFAVIHLMNQQQTNTPGLHQIMEHCVSRVINPNIFNLQFNFNTSAPICGIYKIIDIPIDITL